jgi:hypothetical protein
MREIFVLEKKIALILSLSKDEVAQMTERPPCGAAVFCSETRLAW